MPRQTIFRSAHNPDRDRWVVIDNLPLTNPQLSLKAKGLLAYLLTRPNDWEIRMEHLIKQFSDGRDSIRTAIRELRKAGHLLLSPEKGKDGRIIGWQYTLYEIPIIPEKSPETDLPLVVNPQPGNPPLLSTEELSTENTKYAEPESSPAPARALSESQLAQGRLIALFTSLTGIPEPSHKDRSYGPLWGGPTAKLVKAANGKSEACWVTAIHKMQTDGLTISTPKSVYNTAMAEFGKLQMPTSPQGGIRYV